MDNMINLAPSYTGVCDSEQEPQYGSIKMKICQECNGEKKIYYSDCCGAEIIKGICYDCKNKCNEESEICYNCNGEGEIEL